ncbi:ABC transporter ATP-binding protein, partial [Streptomyces sp. WAC02707]
LMTDRPHRYLVRSSDDRALAAALIADPSTAGIEVDHADGGLRIQAVDFGRFTELLPKVARERGIRLLTVSPSDESLESVFSYLVAA